MEQEEALTPSKNNGKHTRLYRVLESLRSADLCPTNDHILTKKLTDDSEYKVVKLDKNPPRVVSRLHHLDIGQPLCASQNLRHLAGTYAVTSGGGGEGGGGGGGGGGGSYQEKYLTLHLLGRGCFLLSLFTIYPLSSVTTSPTSSCPASTSQKDYESQNHGPMSY